jgi:hypothetical protein
MSGNKKVKLYVPLLKSVDEERTVTGIVLKPNVVDAQGQVADKKVIKDAAFDFLSKYNTDTKIGYMHENFDIPFELCESSITKQTMVIDNSVIPEGSWLMTVRVLDDEIWDKVKKGEIKGFSIGGVATIEQLEEN